MALRDEHPLWEATAQFAQLLLEHCNELEDYREELGRLGYWIVCEDFDRQAVNPRLPMLLRVHERRKGGPDAYPGAGHH